MNGTLFYLLGASGAGKDTLIRAARVRLGERAGLRFARRWITRPRGNDAENHRPTTLAEFAARAAGGGFLLYWRSHGHCYGIPAEVGDWLAAGDDVLVNGSRAYLPTAMRRVRHVVPIAITVPPAVLRARLLARGRESATEVESRLARARELERTLPADVLRVDNDGDIDTACARLCELISGQSATGRQPATPE